MIKNKHILMIMVDEGESGSNDAHLDFKGDKTSMAQAICGLMQVDARFEATVMEAVVNYLKGNKMTIQDYVVKNREN